MFNNDTRQLKSQFDERHGNDGIWLENGVLLFSDGAWRTGDAVPELHQPPAQPFERARMQLGYHEERLRQKAAEFNELQTNLARAAEAAMREGRLLPNGEAGVTQLESLQAEVVKLAARLEQAREVLEQAKPQDQRRREQFQAEAQAAGQSLIARIRAIKV